MANGADRLFRVIKDTSEETQPTQAQLISLTVKSLNPLLFNRDDRLDIVEDFCVFDINFNRTNMQVNDIVQALLLNDGQLYYILPNIDINTSFQPKVLSGTTTPLNSLGNNGDIYLQYS